MCRKPLCCLALARMVKINQADFPNVSCVPRCCSSSQHRLRARSRISEVGPRLFACMPEHLHQLINTYTLTHGRWGEVPYRAETPGALKTREGSDLSVSYSEPRAEVWLWHLLSYIPTAGEMCVSAS